MEKKMIKKIGFFLPPIILAALTCIWLFYKDGRWYTYHDEWQWLPLLLLHLLFPLIYFIIGIVSIIKHVDKQTRASSDWFYIIASPVMTVVCVVGLLTYIIMTSGA